MQTLAAVKGIVCIYDPDVAGVCVYVCGLCPQGATGNLYDEIRGPCLVCPTFH